VRIYSDKKTGTTTDRAGLTALFRYARAGDTLVVHTLARLGRNLLFGDAERATTGFCSLCTHGVAQPVHQVL
jgi:DNA invertase Pin-like site-specific DNA recombinase